MLRRLLLSLCFAFVFGLGQHGAAVHAISHLADEQQRGSQQDQKSHHLSFCDQCAAYAALDSAVDADTPHAALLSGTTDLFALGERRQLSSHALHYSARAPPTLA